MQMGYHNLKREDIRIINIKSVEDIELASPPEDGIVNVSLTYRHEGVSRLRRGGQLYLFRSGRYRVDHEGDAASSRYLDDKMYWGTDVTYKARTKKYEVTHRKPDEVEKWLVQHLLDKDDKRDTSPLTSFRPSAWARITIARSATPSNSAGTLKRLELKVGYAAHNVDQKLGTVFVRQPAEIQSLIRCDTVDVNRLGDGQGSFLRTFAWSLSPKVAFTAPKHFGGREFAGWLIDEKPVLDRTVHMSPGPLWWVGGEDNHIPRLDPSKLERTEKLILDLANGSSYTVEPYFLPPTETPVIETGETWPACPAGWGFEDWLFINHSTRSITIGKLDIVPWSKGRAWPALAVNKPQGNDQIKLSFERLTLAPGVSTKISVCTNPEVDGSDKEQIQFEWNGDRDVAVRFNGKGEVTGQKKRVSSGNEVWEDIASAFDLDAENRTLTLRG